MLENCTGPRISVQSTRIVFAACQLADRSTLPSATTNAWLGVASWRLSELVTPPIARPDLSAISVRLDPRRSLCGLYLPRIRAVFSASPKRSTALSVNDWCGVAISRADRRLLRGDQSSADERFADAAAPPDCRPRRDAWPSLTFDDWIIVALVERRSPPRAAAAANYDE